jgi:macrodomain Ter protein organizer (MatP/YcbG family)
MSTAIKVNFSKEVDDLVYSRLSEMVKEKKRKVTISEALEALLKDAYLRKEKETN